MYINYIKLIFCANNKTLRGREVFAYKKINSCSMEEKCTTVCNEEQIQTFSAYTPPSPPPPLLSKIEKNPPNPLFPAFCTGLKFPD
jgi:hypothetical protein